MAQEFVLTDFIRNTDQNLLMQYCKAQGISYQYAPNDDIADAVKRFIAVWEKLERKIRLQAELDFRTINDMFPQSGFLNLLAEANHQGVKLPQKKLKTMTSRSGAFWFFLNHPNIFDDAAVNYEVQETLGWKEAQAKPKEKSTVIGKEAKLAEALRNHFYYTEYRGDKCVVELHQIEDLICYVAYPEDWAESAVGYDTKGTLNKRQAHKPVFKIYFVFEPATGRISVKGKGGWEKVRELQKLFANVVLNQELDTNQERIFELNVLKDFTFAFPTQPEDKVRFVRVKLLRFSYPDAMGRRLTLEVKNGNKNNLEGIRDFVNDLYIHIPLDKLNISQATILVQFPQPSKQMKGSVTAHLTHPNSWDLNNTPLHRKVKQYLKNWGIDNGFSIAENLE